MDTVHRYIAYSIPTGFAVLMLWTIVAFLRNKTPGDGFWNLLGSLQVVVGIQALVGIVLFATGARPQSNGPSWLHYIYGAIFPALVLTIAHHYARRLKYPWAAFGIAGLVCFGLTFRALQTGLGID